MQTYKIVRYFQNHASMTIKTGLTLEEAQEHTNDKETSWRSATNKTATDRTGAYGPWFDGYTKE